MKAIGVTGSIASGKSTVAKLVARNKYPLFNADQVVLNLYKNKKFIKLLSQRFKLNKRNKIKNQIISLIKNKVNLKRLETLIHPFVRKEMNIFLKKRSKILVLEIPLLIESKLNKYFDKIVFVDASKKIRLSRYLKNNNDKNTFESLNKRQLSPNIKKRSCDFIINNNFTLAILKKSVKKFIANYE